MELHVPHFFEDSVYDLVLGSDFLMLTKTMPGYKSRLSRIPTPPLALPVLYVNTFGCVTQHVQRSTRWQPCRGITRFWVRAKPFVISIRPEM